MKTLLIVEDEKDILETMINTLELDFSEKELTILTALNGSEALNIVDKNPSIDLIITDLNMPILDGLSMIKEIRKTNKEIEFVVFTGHGQMDEFTQLQDYGVRAMISKPFIVKLMDEVAKILTYT